MKDHATEERMKRKGVMAGAIAFPSLRIKKVEKKAPAVPAIS